MVSVSICIPAYNNVPLLIKLFNSIRIQTFQDYEIIVSDDTRGNSIKEVALNFYFPQALHYFHNDPDLGSPGNWNAAIAKASGKYIKIIHHDDWLRNPTSLATFVSMMESDPEAEFAFSGAEIRSINGEVFLHQPSSHLLTALKNDPRVVFNGNFIGSPSATIYKESTRLVFDENLKWVVDIDFYIRLLFNNRKFVYSEEPLVIIYEAEDRITNSCINNKEVEIFEYFFVYDKIRRITGMKDLGSNLMQLGNLCLRYNIGSVQEIKNLNYKGYIPFFIRLLLKV